MKNSSKKVMYRRFKEEVLTNCYYECENKHCDAEANQVHHMFKCSTYPEYKLDPDNGMGVCGSCHSEIERRIREDENWQELIPMDRYIAMENKINDIHINRSSIS